MKRHENPAIEWKTKEEKIIKNWEKKIASSKVDEYQPRTEETTEISCIFQMQYVEL